MKGLIACCFAVLSAASLAQRDFSQVEIATHRLADNLMQAWRPKSLELVSKSLRQKS